jgi:hypothetical protein
VNTTTQLGSGVLGFTNSGGVIKPEAGTYEVTGHGDLGLTYSAAPGMAGYGLYIARNGTISRYAVGSQYVPNTGGFDLGTVTPTDTMTFNGTTDTVELQTYGDGNAGAVMSAFTAWGASSRPSFPTELILKRIK